MHTSTVEYVKAAGKAATNYSMTVGKEVGILEESKSGNYECLSMVALDTHDGGGYLENERRTRYIQGLLLTEENLELLNRVIGK